ncbi:MAG: flagellar filament capping protein FliD [Steroidobacteraceae bacterium]
MATSTAVGGSQIDVASLAKQLVAAERAPLDQQIARDTGRVTTRLSALGTLKGSLSNFQKALTSLKTTDAFAARKAISSNPDVFTASTTASAVPGRYDIEVVQLAKAQQLASAPFPAGSMAVVGTGTLTLGIGSSSFTVTIDSTNSTLAGIRDAINGAADNVGVSATLVQTAAGSRLVLSSDTTGAGNGIVVSQAGGDGGLAQLTYSASATANYTQLSPAQDAIVNIATFETRSSTNTLEGAIDGVTLSLLDQAPGSTLALTVSHDTSTAMTRVRTFVTEYNALQAQVIKLRAFDPTTKVAGPMIGDALLNGVESQLRRTMTAPVVGAAEAYNSLASIGIKTKSDGTLSLDETRLQRAVDANFDAVGALFGSENGIAATLSTQVEGRLASDGALEIRNKNLVKEKLAIDKRQSDTNARMEMVLQRYIKQFSALDTLLSRLSSTSSYLGQQFDALANLNK